MLFQLCVVIAPDMITASQPTQVGIVCLDFKGWSRLRPAVQQAIVALECEKTRAGSCRYKTEMNLARMAIVVPQQGEPHPSDHRTARAPCSHSAMIASIAGNVIAHAMC